MRKDLSQSEPAINSPYFLKSVTANIKSNFYNTKVIILKVTERCLV